MFKVLIIDDEPFIRKGLVTIINWKQYGCEVCGEASDGVEGLEKIRLLKPDIVFVDINMPEVNGLEMIRLSKEVIPSSKFIILTGYRDFSYLQEAIKLGAYDYILKPSKIEEISDILKRAVFELKLKEEETIEIDQLKEKFEASMPILREKLLSDIMSGYEMTDEEMFHQAKLYNIDLKEFLVMYVSIDSDYLNKEQAAQKHLYQFGVGNTVLDLFGDSFQVEKVMMNPQTIAFIIQKCQSCEVKLDQAAYIAGNVQQLIERCFDFTVTMTISDVGYGIESLYDKAQECESSLAYRFYMGPSSIILYQDFKGFYRNNDLSKLKQFEKQLTMVIQAGDEVQVLAILEELKQEVRAYSAHPEQIKHFYWTVVYNMNHIRRSIKSLDQSTEGVSSDMNSLYKLIEDSNNIEEIHDLLVTVAVTMTKRVGQYNQQNINITLQKAMQYLRENYNHSITLQDLADEVKGECFEISIMALRFISTVFSEEKQWIDMYVHHIGKTIFDEEKKISKRSELMFCQVLSELRREQDGVILDDILAYIDIDHLHNLSRVSHAINSCILYSSLRRSVMAS